MQELQVHLFGPLTMTYGERKISSEANRARRVWNILAYLLHHHRRTVPGEELIRVFWNDDGGNAAGALKTTMHRVRSLLDLLGENAGHTLLLYKNGGYTWNPEVPPVLDTETFESLLNEAREHREDPEAVLACLCRALALYEGHFCAGQSSETWVLPISAYYQNLYVGALEGAVPLLEKCRRYEEGAALCQRALKVDPYAESFYQLRMRCLLALDQRQAVITLYEDMSKLLLSTFGVMPDQESRELYRQALRMVNHTGITPESLMEQLTEEIPVRDALLCDYDFFQMLYRANARMVSRTGDAVHVVLLSVKGRMGREISQNSLELVMDHLEEHLCASLRKGDVITRCSPSQFAVMLPQANYENSGLVCERFLQSFYRKYPHTPASIDYFVQALRPSAVT